VSKNLKIASIDPSGTGTTGIFLYENYLKKKKAGEFHQFKSKEWKEHLKFITNWIKDKKPEIIIYEDTTYIYGRPHQGTVGLYKLIGGLVSMEYAFNFLKKVESMAVNQVKAFKNKLFKGEEQIEGLTYAVGRGKGWKYYQQRISLHHLDALVVYHLWSGKSLESKSSIQKKIKTLKNKKRLGVRQAEELERLEKLP
jgi:hypothetical protein